MDQATKTAVLFKPMDAANSEAISKSMGTTRTTTSSKSLDMNKRCCVCGKEFPARDQRGFRNPGFTYHQNKCKRRQKAQEEEEDKRKKKREGKYVQSSPKRRDILPNGIPQSMILPGLCSHCYNPRTFQHERQNCNWHEQNCNLWARDQTANYWHCIKRICFDLLSWAYSSFYPIPLFPYHPFYILCYNICILIPFFTLCSKIYVQTSSMHSQIRLPSFFLTFYVLVIKSQGV